MARSTQRSGQNPAQSIHPDKTSLRDQIDKRLIRGGLNYDFCQMLFADAVVFLVFRKVEIGNTSVLDLRVRTEKTTWRVERDMENRAILKEWFDRVDSQKSGNITALQLKVFSLSFFLFFFFNFTLRN